MFFKFKLSHFSYKNIKHYNRSLSHDLLTLLDPLLNQVKGW